MSSSRQRASKQLLVIGAGAWGNAIAIQLAKNKHSVYLWDIDQTHINMLIKAQANERHLAGIKFPANLNPCTELSVIPSEIKDIIFAAPCHALQASLTLIADLKPDKICLLCKGLQVETGQLNHSLVADKLPHTQIAILSGPSFAREVALGWPTLVTIASEHAETATYFAGLFNSTSFRCYTNNDVIGVQIGGAAKNIIAIAAGIADGLGYGANARAALMTRGLHEITRLGIAMGAQTNTFSGLAGVGDLILTCTDDQSRNRRFGLALAEGLSPEQAKDRIQQTIEGISTTIAFYNLAQHHQINLPITEQVFKIIHEQISITDAVHTLLTRDSGAETIC